MLDYHTTQISRDFNLYILQNLLQELIFFTVAVCMMLRGKKKKKAAFDTYQGGYSVGS